MIDSKVKLDMGMVAIYNNRHLNRSEEVGITSMKGHTDVVPLSSG